MTSPPAGQSHPAAARRAWRALKRHRRAGQSRPARAPAARPLLASPPPFSNNLAASRSCRVTVRRLCAGALGPPGGAGKLSQGGGWGAAARYGAVTAGAAGRVCLLPASGRASEARGRPGPRVAGVRGAPGRVVRALFPTGT